MAAALSCMEIGQLSQIGRAIAESAQVQAPEADHSSMETATFAGVFGAMIGSFLNVVVYRLPRHESLVRPASHCTACGMPIKPYDNMPIVSWLLAARAMSQLLGADLQALSARRGLAALLCVGAVLAGGSPATIALNVAFILLLVPIALIDTEHRMIPNKPDSARRCARDGHRRRARPKRRAGAADRRRRSRAGRCWSPRSPTRREWAWATSSSQA